MKEYIIQLDPYGGPIAGTPDVNAKLLGGTAQTGQVKIASGYLAMTWADIGSPTSKNHGTLFAKSRYSS